MIWNPWRALRAVEQHRDDLRKERDFWRHRALLVEDRFEKVKAMNLELRDTLDLYRKG